MLFKNKLFYKKIDVVDRFAEMKAAPSGPD